MKVPLGEYTVRFGKGSIWYGINDKFGFNGTYAKFDNPIRFYKEPSNRIVGKILKIETLYGNLKVRI